VNSKQGRQTPAIIYPDQLLSRARLIQRWQHGSDSFFWRAEAAGRLSPVLHNGLLRYCLHDVLRFEGGLPPEDMTQAYLEDLMTEGQVAAVCDCSAGKVLQEARQGLLKARRIGRAWRFVAAEVVVWQKTRWIRRPRKMNGNPAKSTGKLLDE
jgi:hypothetical protein